MSNKSISRVMTANAPSPAQKPEEIQETIHRLIGLSVAGLVPMFDREKQLFCYKLKKTPSGLVQEGISHRYTVITLMGLHRLEESGANSPIEIKPVLDGLLANTEWVDNAGDLGLLLWLSALMAPDRLAEVARTLDVKGALTRFGDVKQGRTMELAWFLAGLSHGSLARPDWLPEARDLAVETYRQLIGNQGERGAFGHLSRSKSISGLVRGGVGSFADQVYPIYAMSKFALAFSDGKAKDRALDCALNICEAQGPLGQWWWHYDSATGQVVDGFPVFSVHQHGMAPMTLFALGEVIQSDFSPWIYKGLQWIADNELGFDMEDASANLVWRCIARPTSRKYLNVAAGMFSQRDNQTSRDNLKVLFECRPYELGFLLYAFADKDVR
jgi:hypothetical protein